MLLAGQVASTKVRVALAAAIALLLSALPLPEFGQALKLLSDPDAVIRLSVAVGGERADANPVTIVDIDEATYTRWGRPAHVPRDRLIALLERIAQGRPSAILLDIDLAGDQIAGHAEIAEFLTRHAREPGAPPLLLSRYLSRQDIGADGIQSVQDRPTRLDAIVAGAPNLRWVSVHFEGETDWFLRQWRAAHFVCADGPPRGYPSVGLATASVRDGAAGERALQSWLDRAAKAACRGQPLPRDASPPWLTNAHRKLPVPYAVGFTTDVAQFGTTRSGGGGVVPLFTRLGAGDILAAESPPSLTGRIAVIGATYAESRDFHRTPLGEMPGLYVIANLAALATIPLSEARWKGFRPYLFGAAFFILHLIAARTLRPAPALAAITGVTLVLTVAFVVAGMSPYVVHEAAITGLGMMAAYLALMALMDLANVRQVAGSTLPVGACLLLSDDMQRWLARRRAAP